MEKKRNFSHILSILLLLGAAFFLDSYSATFLPSYYMTGRQVLSIEEIQPIVPTVVDEQLPVRPKKQPTIVVTKDEPLVISDTSQVADTKDDGSQILFSVTGSTQQVLLSWHAANQGVQTLTVPAKPSQQEWPWQKLSNVQSQDEALSVGDIDNDGDMDVSTGTTWLESTVHGWTQHTLPLTITNGVPDRNKLADVDLDGDLDVVIGAEEVPWNNPTFPHVVWLEAPNDPKQVAQWKMHTIANNIVGYSMDVADMDRDGDADVIIGEHKGKKRVLVFENALRENKGWLQHVVDDGSSQAIDHHDGTKAVDLDKDGDMDIVSIAWNAQNALYIYENTAPLPNPQQLTFTELTIDATSSRPKNPHVKTLVDIDLDGDLDAIAGSSLDGGDLYWYQYPGWTRYKIHENTATGYSTDMRAADVDNDGDMDFLTPKINKNTGKGEHVYWQENPLPKNSVTSPWQEYYVGPAGAHDVAHGDFDKDGKLDFVVREGTTSIFFQDNTPPKSQQDWTSIVVSTTGTEGTTVADMDRDGDLDIVLNGFWLENPLPSGDARDKKQWAFHSIHNKWYTTYKETSVNTADVNGDGYFDVLIAPSELANLDLAWYEAKNHNPKSGSCPNNDCWIEHIIDRDVSFAHTFKTGDVDGDGDIDVLTGEMHQANDQRYNKGAKHPARTRVHLNPGPTTTPWPTKEVDVARAGIHNLRIGDIEHDGDLDVFGANWHSTCCSVKDGAKIKYFRNNLNPRSSLDNWKRHTHVTKPYRAIFITPVDVDRDGWQDLVTGAWWFKNPGTIGGTWVQKTISPSAGVKVNNYALVHDFDKDGDADILGTQGVRDTANSEFVFARNNGVGAFTSFKANFPGNRVGKEDFLQGVALVDNAPSGLTPRLDSINPNVVINDKDNTPQLLGANFMPGAIVKVNGVPYIKDLVFYRDQGRIDVLVLENTPPAIYPLTVLNPSGKESNPKPLTVQQGAGLIVKPTKPIQPCMYQGKPC